MRSKWKCKKLNYSLALEYLEKCVDRDLYIYPRYVGLYFEVHDGNGFRLLEIKSEMVGYNLGEFILTKKLGNIHTLNKKSHGFRKKKSKK